ncbi:MAG: cation transporter [Acidimicrobiales bacterium]
MSSGSSPPRTPSLACSAPDSGIEPVAYPQGSAAWERAAKMARVLSWVTLAWLGIEAGVAVGAALAARSVALLGFGLDSGIEALASIIVIWRLTGARRDSESAERRGQRLVAISFLILGPYIAVEALIDLASGTRPETSLVGIALTAFTAVFEPAVGLAKRRLGRALGSGTVGGEGTQNLLCAAQAAAVLAGLVANTLFGAWWVDPAVALVIAAVALREGLRAWQGKQSSCACSCGPDPVPQPGISVSAQRTLDATTGAIGEGLP